MKYKAFFNEKEKEIDILRIDLYNYRVQVGDRVHQIDARLCSPDLLSVLVDNTSYDILFSRNLSRFQLNFRNNHFAIELMDERRARESSHSQGAEIIRTSMPGKVIKILVYEGQNVEPGTSIVIIEAMKMENEIQCKRKGIVNAIHIKPGQVVEADVPLVEIGPPI